MNPQQEKSILFFVHIGTDRFNHIKYDMFRRMCSAKPYWDEDFQMCLSMKPFALLYIIFSKILLKFDNNEISL